MRRRPLCLVWVMLMAILVILRALGLPPFRPPTLTREAKDLIEAEEELSVTGRIESCKESRSSMQYVLDHAVIRHGRTILMAGDRPLDLSRLLITTTKDVIYPAGSFIRCRGSLSRIEPPGNPGQFNAQIYYEASGIYYSMYSDRIWQKKEGDTLSGRLFALRGRLSAFLRDALPEESAGVYAQMILGEKLLLQRDTRRDYQSAGILHVLAISGLHISLIGMTLFLLLLRFCCSTPVAAALSSAFLAVYCVMIQSPGSAVRAFIMFAVLMGSRVTKRSYDLISALSLAGILVLLASPATLFLSGYQLSFGAVLGAGVVRPVLKQEFRACFKTRRHHTSHGRKRNKRIEKLKKQGKTMLLDGLLTYAAVSLVTIPLLAYHTYELSLAGIFCNLLFVPLMEFVLMCGAVGCLSWFLSAFLARVLLLPGAVLLEIIGKILRMIRCVPYSTVITGQPALWQMGCYYVILAAVLIFAAVRQRAGWVREAEEQAGQIREIRSRRSPNRKLRAGRVLLARSAAALGAGFLLLFIRKPVGSSMTMLDVGQGDCIVIRDRGAVYLIDGGSSDVKEVGTYRILPCLKQMGIRRLDGILISHDDADHINGIQELIEGWEDRTSGISIGQVYLPEWMKPGGQKKQANAEKEEEGIDVQLERTGLPVRYLYNGMEICDGDLRLRALHPFRGRGFRTGNEGSMVLRLDRGSFSALLTGDLEGQGEDETLPYIGEVDCLKVAHHGSKGSTSEAFLKRARPKLALISAPQKSRYGHPHKELLKRLEKRQIPVLVTRDCGAITVTQKGEEMRITTFRKFGGSNGTV
jgi:competence protein ComEC